MRNVFFQPVHSCTHMQVVCFAERGMYAVFCDVCFKERGKSCMVERRLEFADESIGEFLCSRDSFCREAHAIERICVADNKIVTTVSGEQVGTPFTVAVPCCCSVILCDLNFYFLPGCYA